MLQHYNIKLNYWLDNNGVNVKRLKVISLVCRIIPYQFISGFLFSVIATGISVFYLNLDNLPSNDINCEHTLLPLE